MMTSVPSRRPPPPPPRRRAPITPKDPDYCGTDSGISESSSVSSLPLITSYSPDKVDNDLSKLSLDSEMSESGLKEASLSASVLSLPSNSYRRAKSEVFSTSLVLQQNTLRRPPAPPVRSDSVSKMTRSPEPKLSFEQKFSFHSCEDLPAPPPLSAEKKSYPTKELFASSPSPSKENEEPGLLQDSIKKKVKKPHRLSLDPASLLNKIRFGGAKTPSRSPAVKTRSNAKSKEDPRR